MVSIGEGIFTLLFAEIKPMVKLIWITSNPERVIAFCARVSNPSNQNNPEYEKLFRYLINHRHWSPFEMASMCVEIETTRDIAAQLTRHRSFSFQQLSTRYSKHEQLEVPRIRRQDSKNRQNSIDDLPDELHQWWNEQVVTLYNDVRSLYDEALEKGVAKECARGILPLSTKTTLYMVGTIRSWIHYLEVRLAEETQLEHRLVAQDIARIFIQQCPVIAEAIGLSLSAPAIAN